ncbi:MAG: NfeD family protein [Gammaproteobacteria bacterium]|nr:NfeD family protein [Gammaproteobacteria bacterium]MBU1625438.1 NfeD family protein [Gammaproteobacteria bacterium]MBU1981698.1 NfeD family protein [Gammaproteobacteria bacterium]
MGLVSWLVYGVLCMLMEFLYGSMYLFGIGLAFAYPAYADYSGADLNTQLAALAAGAIAHSLIVFGIRSARKGTSSKPARPEVGERVEVIEWLDECSARVTCRGQEWQADKFDSRMPDAMHGTIHSVQGSRLIITTEQAAEA